MRCLYARLVYWPTLGWNVLLGRTLKVRAWWSRVDDHVILGAVPFRSDVDLLHSEGVAGVINTCHEYEGPRAEYERLGIDQLHLPTIDFTPPTLDDVTKGVEYIRRHAESGRTVYVHCKAGRARSATVVACWLIASRGISPDEAQRILLECRPFVLPRIAQRQVVRDFHANHNAKPADTNGA
jgi:atypical dual specificity phosphatase